MNTDNPLQSSPVKDYSPPNLPTLEEARDSQMPMPLPSRWRKGVAVLACIGVMGALAVYGGVGSRHSEPMIYYCPINQPEEYALARINARLEAARMRIGVHHGGAVGVPIYVAHITEQEVLAFIRARLELAGLNFDAEPPSYRFTNWGNEIGITLFDEERRIAIAYINWVDTEQHFMPRGRFFAERVAEELTRQSRNAAIRVFYNPGEEIYSPRGRRNSISRATMSKKRDEARPVLIQRLNAQIDAFLASLWDENIR